MRTHTHVCTCAHLDEGVKQCALIKHSHYTQEEIPAGAVYQSLVHFLLLLFLGHVLFLLPLASFSIPAQAGSFTLKMLPMFKTCHPIQATVVEKSAMVESTHNNEHEMEKLVLIFASLM